MFFKINLYNNYKFSKLELSTNKINIMRSISSFYSDPNL